MEASISALLSSSLAVPTDYQVVVVTGSEFSSGTDSSVFLRLVGDGGDSGEYELKQSERLNKFETGQTDTFTFHSDVALGSVLQVHVRLQEDGNLIKKSWRLRSVEVSGGDLSAPVTFEHGHVLSPDNPSVVLRSNAAAETSVTAAQPQRSKSGLNKKASTRVKGAVFSKEVAFGPEMQRVLPSGNEAPVCFIINVQSNTLIVGQFLVVNLTSSTFYSFVQDMKMAPSLTAVFPTWSTKFSLCLLSAVDSRQLPPLTRILLSSVRAMILRLPLLFVGALRIHTWATALCHCAFPL
jgi:hypothetical protein